MLKNSLLLSKLYPISENVLLPYSSTFPTVRPWSVRTDLRRSQHATVQLYRTVPKYRSFATLCQLGRLQ
jgi:hypothetical protein